jgi:hypothetical protein
MTNTSFFTLSRSDRVELFSAAAEKLRIAQHMVEKDAWVCWTLEHLFGLPAAREHFIFKGGTSLSKVWKVIHRFSEDIDISLSREWLGFTGERDPEAAQGKERRRRLDALAAACSSKLNTEVLPALRQRFTKVLGASGWSLDVAPDDSQTLLFSYQTAFTEIPGAAYVSPVVKIECGARSDRWPVSAQSIAPYLAEAFPEGFPNGTFLVPVLDIERTFWEKATILHAEAHRPADKPIPERFSRHYADLASLALVPAGAAALARDDLRARVVEHKQVFFASAWASFPTAVPGSFRLIPPADRLAVLSADYRAMQEMFFRPPPTWAEVVEVLTKLETRINQPA